MEPFRCVLLWCCWILCSSYSFFFFVFFLFFSLTVASHNNEQYIRSYKILLKKICIKYARKYFENSKCFWFFVWNTKTYVLCSTFYLYWPRPNQREDFAYVWLSSLDTRLTYILIFFFLLLDLIWFFFHRMRKKP